MSVIKSIFNLLRFNRKNWKAVVLCVLAATVFWFFNSLNKRYTTNISFPVSFDYDEENYIAVKPLPSSVRINVTGVGWDLFRRSLGIKIPPLVIPLERPGDIKRIPAIPALFAHQMERLELNFVLSDTLRLDLQPKSQRWITVRLNASAIQIKNGYRRTSEMQITPDSIFIEGPANLVNGFIEPVYLKLAERRLDSDYREDVEVEFLEDDLIERNPPTVEVSFSIDKMVAIRDSVKLSIINFPKEAKPSFGVQKLLCEFLIPERQVSDYNPDSVTAVIDLISFKGGSRKFKPEISGLPPYSDVTKVDSIFVKLY